MVQIVMYLEQTHHILTLTILGAHVYRISGNWYKPPTKLNILFCLVYSIEFTSNTTYHKEAVEIKPYIDNGD